jgi:hypothetical protein
MKYGLKSVLIAASLVASSPYARAQAPKTTADLGIDYQELVRSRTSISSLGNDLFGDKTNLYTGETKFIQVDIEIPGNNQIPVRLVRTSPRQPGYHIFPLADWEFDFPHLTGSYAVSDGWVVRTPTGTGKSNSRCSVSTSAPTSASPPDVYVPSQGAPSSVGISFEAHHFWRGITLHDPNSNDQPMLVLDPGAPRPTGSTPFYWGTQSRWVFSCLPTTANGFPGEGFLAHAPDGMKYWFDWIVPIPRSARTLTGYLGVDMWSYKSELGVRQYKALPTKIEDRDGNTVLFTYEALDSQNVTSIVASDGRSIGISYTNGLASSATTGGRTWSYRYSSPNGLPLLTEVELPDGSRWKFNADSLLSYGSTGWKNCADFVGVETTDDYVTTMVHPSGATGVFRFGVRLHGRTDVPRNCYQLGVNSFPLESHITSAVALFKKQISGAGLVAPLVWSFDYGVRSASFVDTPTLDDCATTPCPTTRTLKVTRENGEWERYTFGQKHGDLEGKLLRHEKGVGQRVLFSKEILYKSSVRSLFGRIGANPCAFCNKGDEFPLPVELQDVHQDGVLFRYRVDAFDGYARPIRVTRSSASE